MADQRGVWLVDLKSVCGRMPTACRLHVHCLWHGKRCCSCNMQLVALYKCYIYMCYIYMY